MNGSPSPTVLEVMAAALEASGEYRVVRRLRTPDLLPSPAAGARLGLVLDVETTGADLRGDEVIELAMVRFAYTPEGEVLGVVDTFQGYREPTRPISAEFTALTGISAETVAGHVLDPEVDGTFVARRHDRIVLRIPVSLTSAGPNAGGAGLTHSRRWERPLVGGQLAPAPIDRS